ncbi:hypothetical protein [Hirschia litorea]|uniref:ABC transmembrane type-1 domain-containing protein n=1 Tax=Hirschia litorea TaxID=1199156 RepID=A0ABW2IME0_9PROT
MDSFTIAAIAIAVFLSAIVRIIRTDAAWKAVDEGYASAEHLQDLTGILKRSGLQDVFGPPTMDGIFHTSRDSVIQARRLTGHLMGNLRFDAASIVVAILVLVWKPYGGMGAILDLAIFCAFLYQLAGWGATAMLMNDKS